MKKLLSFIILLSIIILLTSCRTGETVSIKPFNIEQVIDLCDKVDSIIGVESTEEHLLYKLPITSNYNLEIIDDEYGWQSSIALG